MTRDDDFIGQLESYLDEYEGNTPLPIGVRDAIRADLPKTRQIGPIAGLMRDTNLMSKPVQYAIAAAAALVVAVVGYQLLSGPGVGGPDRTKTPQPSSMPSSSASASAAARGVLEPGPFTFFVLPDLGITGTATIPGTGWYGLEGDGLVDNGSADPPGGAQITVWGGQLAVYGDACHWAGTPADPRTGLTVDDLVVALSAQLSREAAAPTEIMVDGHAGKAMELTVPADIAFADCDNNEFRTWKEVESNTPLLELAPGQHDLVWIIDVNGKRVVIDTTFYEGTSAADRAELQAILDSIHFQ